MSGRMVSLDDFFVGEVELANFAAQIMTERESSRDDSIWLGSSYGSTVRNALPDVTARELVRREIERVSDVTGVDVEIEIIDGDGVNIRVVNADLVLTQKGIEGAAL